MQKFLSRIRRAEGFSLTALLLVVAIVAVMTVGMVMSAKATALDQNRQTPQRDGAAVELLQGSNYVWAGSLLVVNSSGTAEPATDAASKSVVGKAMAESDNTGLNYLATRTVKIQRGVFRWENGGSFTDANIGDLAYVADDQTVTTAGAATYDIIAGWIIDVDSDGVWVMTTDLGSQGAATPASLAVAGAASVGTTLAVSGASTLTGAAKLGSTLAVAGTSSFTGAVTCVSSATAASFNISTGSLKRVGTALVWIEGAVTNALDADVTQ